jgi:hypothetical protein
VEADGSSSSSAASAPAVQVQERPRLDTKTGAAIRALQLLSTAAHAPAEIATGDNDGQLSIFTQGRVRQPKSHNSTHGCVVRVRLGSVSWLLCFDKRLTGASGADGMARAVFQCNPSSHHTHRRQYVPHCRPTAAVFVSLPSWLS